MKLFTMQHDFSFPSQVPKPLDLTPWRNLPGIEQFISLDSLFSQENPNRDSIFNAACKPRDAKHMQLGLSLIADPMEVR